MKKWIAWALAPLLLAGAAFANPYYSYPQAGALTGSEIVGPIQQNGQDYSTTTGAFAQLALNTVKPAVLVGPTSGSTVLVPLGQLLTAINGGSTLSSLTVAFPDTAPNGYQFEVVSFVAVTTLTLSSALPFAYNLSTLAAGGHFTYCRIYAAGGNATTGVWMPC